MLSRVISRIFSEPTTTECFLDMQKQYVFPHVDQIIKNNLNGSLLFQRCAPTLEPCSKIPSIYKTS